MNKISLMFIKVKKTKISCITENNFNSFLLNLNLLELINLNITRLIKVTMINKYCCI